MDYFKREVRVATDEPNLILTIGALLLWQQNSKETHRSVQLKPTVTANHA
jgi:hypothetical protein